MPTNSPEQMSNNTRWGRIGAAVFFGIYLYIAASTLINGGTLMQTLNPVSMAFLGAGFGCIIGSELVRRIG